jgi:hypothetical protein
VESARQVTGARCPEALSIVFAPSGEINFTEPSACPPIVEENVIRNTSISSFMEITKNTRCGLKVP